MKATAYVLFLSSLLFAGCNDNFPDFLTNNTDRVVVTFYHRPAPGQDEKEYSYEITDKETIRFLINGITSTDADWYKCAYNGYMDFYHDTTKLNDEIVEFNLHDGCRHIVFTYKKKSYSRKMKPELVRYLSEKYNLITGTKRFIIEGTK